MCSPCSRRCSPFRVYKAIERRTRIFLVCCLRSPPFSPFLGNKHNDYYCSMFKCCLSQKRREFQWGRRRGSLCKKVFILLWILLHCVPFANLTWNIILRHENNGRDFMVRIIKQKSWQKDNPNMHTWLAWINWRNNRVKWWITTLWFD